MDIPLDELVYVEAIASSATGAAVDADATPTFAVYEEATDTDIGVGGNMTKRTSLTGDYRASFTASAANGFEVGKWYSVIGSATIGGVATKGVLKTFRIIVAEATAGVHKADLTYILGTIITEGGAGRLAGGFSTMYNVASPVFTVASVNQTGDLYGSMVVRANTAQAGTTTTIQLDASASATNSIYNGEIIFLRGNTGVSQVRTITGYNGTTKQASVDRAFQTAPDNTTTFSILASNNPRLNTNLEVQVGNPSVVIRSGTAQAGSTSSTIVLDSGASPTNNIYNGNLITITGGTGLGQSRPIVSYDGGTKVATTAPNWVVTPDNTSTFDIYASSATSIFSDAGVAQAGGATSVTLASTASATDSLYVDSWVTILSGTGAGQTRRITAYNGTTKAATVDSAWSSNPDSTSAYAVIPSGNTDLSGSSGPTLAEILAGIIADHGAGSYVSDTGPFDANLVSINGNNTTATGPAVAFKTTVAAIGDEMALIDNAITEAKIDEPAEGTGYPSGFLAGLRQLINRFFSKVDRDKVGNTIKTYQSDGTTLQSTQTTVTNASNDTVNKAS